MNGNIVPIGEKAEGNAGYFNTVGNSDDNAGIWGCTRRIGRVNIGAVFRVRASEENKYNVSFA